MTGAAPDPDHHGHPPVEIETGADVRAETVLLERAIGGWRGIIDSGLPTAVFITAYLVTGSDLQNALLAAVVAGLAIVVWRLVRRESLQQVVSGFLAVIVAALVTRYTGRAEDFFLPGLLTNIAYGTAFFVSVLVRWPLLGLVLGYLTGDGTTWRQDVDLRRRYAAASWIWVGLFYGRVVVQLPLYLTGAVGALGVMKIVMGWPLFLLAAYLTYRLLQPVWAAKRAQ